MDPTMDLRNNWMSKLKEEFSRSSVASTLSFVLIQLVLEKLVETEFSCPCDSKYNYLHTSVCFIVPPFIVFSLMYVSACHCKLFDALKLGIIPAGVWLVIVFLDGRYYACAMTDWSGKYEMIVNAEPQKWCQPLNPNSSQELLAKTQFLYSESQFFGFLAAFLLTFFYILCLIISSLFSYCCANMDRTTIFLLSIFIVPLSTYCLVLWIFDSILVACSCGLVCLALMFAGKLTED